MSSSLEAIHGDMVQQFNQLKDDIKIAQDLELLFNKLLYDQEMIDNSYNSSIGSLLTKAIDNQARDYLLERLNEKFNLGDKSIALNNLQGNTNKQTGDLLESVVDIVGQMIFSNSLGQDYKYEKNLTITGAKQRVIGVADNAVKGFLQSISKKIDIQDNTTISAVFSVPKPMKMDTDYSQLKLAVSEDATLKPELEQLCSLSFTVKNLNKLPAHLEDIYPSQAYAGLVEFLGEFYVRTNQEKAINKLYEYYINRNNDSDYFQHLSHIVRTQALVAAGQIEVESHGTGRKKTYTTVGPAKIPRFLIVNQRGSSHIYVRSTYAIIRNILESDTGFASGTDVNQRIGVYYTNGSDNIGTVYHYGSTKKEQ